MKRAFRTVAFLAAFALCCVWAGGCLAMSLRKLKVRSAKVFVQDVNAILTSENKAALPELADTRAQAGSGEFKYHHSATTSTGVFVAATRDAKGKEAIIVSLPIASRGDDAALSEFVDVLGAVVISFAGVEYVTPVERALFVNGKTDNGTYYAQYAYLGNLFTLSINAESGYVFTYESVD